LENEKKNPYKNALGGLSESFIKTILERYLNLTGKSKDEFYHLTEDKTSNYNNNIPVIYQKKRDSLKSHNNNNKYPIKLSNESHPYLAEYLKQKRNREEIHMLDQEQNIQSPREKNLDNNLSFHGSEELNFDNPMLTPNHSMFKNEPEMNIFNNKAPNGNINYFNPTIRKGSIDFGELFNQNHQKDNISELSYFHDNHSINNLSRNNSTFTNNLNVDLIEEKNDLSLDSKSQRSKKAKVNIV
jgi:hypothetical protein